MQCVREVREVHALSLTLTHLKYWLTHFCNNLKPDGGETESPMVSWAPHFVTALSGNNGNVRIFFRVPNVRRFHFGNSNFLPHFQSLWTYIVKLQFIY